MYCYSTHLILDLQNLYLGSCKKFQDHEFAHFRNYQQTFIDYRIQVSQFRAFFLSKNHLRITSIIHQWTLFQSLSGQYLFKALKQKGCLEFHILHIHFLPSHLHKWFSYQNWRVFLYRFFDCSSNFLYKMFHLRIYIRQFLPEFH